MLALTFPTSKSLDSRSLASANEAYLEKCMYFSSSWSMHAVDAITPLFPSLPYSR